MASSSELVRDGLPTAARVAWVYLRGCGCSWKFGSAVPARMEGRPCRVEGRAVERRRGLTDAVPACAGAPQLAEAAFRAG
ncbi:MAG TPA: hypothetical protein VF167_02755 [Longimicrobiaceae bacterium]